MDLGAILLRKLRSQRDGLLWKVEGLGEYELRLPRTTTGTNLLGLVKHCASVEYGYLVTSVGRSSPLVIPEVDFDADPNGDLVATAAESADELIHLYREVGLEVDRSAEELDLDSPAHVEWWGEKGDTTFGQLLVHVLAEIARHAGHADIVRESIDGSTGLHANLTNIWDPEEGWGAHVERVTELAERFRDQDR